MNSTWTVFEKRPSVSKMAKNSFCSCISFFNGKKLALEIDLAGVMILYAKPKKRNEC